MVAQTGDGYDLASAHTELRNLAFDAADVHDFLSQVASMACHVIVPPAVCGVTLRRGAEVSTVGASGDGLAARADELQYERADGPCLQALATDSNVVVHDMARETRWGTYPHALLDIGLHSSLSIPLRVGGAPVGALNVYSREPHRHTAEEIARGEGFATGASAALGLVLRRVEHETLTEQMGEALVTRAAIDQAMGIIMGTRRCSASAAFAVLRSASQNSNRKTYEVAADLIAKTTGHRFEAPRPFAQRDGI